MYKLQLYYIIFIMTFCINTDVTLQSKYFFLFLILTKVNIFWIMV